VTTPKPPTPAPPVPPVAPRTAAPSTTVAPSTTTVAPSTTPAQQPATTEPSSPAPDSPAASPTTTSTTETTATSEPSTTETSTDAPTTEPAPDPDRPKDPAEAAWYDAVAAEHAAIYGYGVVSAHVMPDDNALVSQAVAEHRDRREAAVRLLTERSQKVPLPAPGYQLPLVVGSQKTAAKLAVRMESDCAVAWRAVLEQSDSDQDREFGTKALTQCAVLAARWRRVLGSWPVTEAFPGGSE